MSKTAIFFGPENGAVHRVANLIMDLIGPGNADLVPVRSASPADLEKYDRIIFGISTVGKETWDGKPAATDWGKFLPQVSKAGMEGKLVAIYGLGDHITYSFSFVDFMGLLAKEVMKTGAKIVGQVPVEGYEFDESAAVFEGVFTGLPLDEDFEPELTRPRLEKWIFELVNKYAF